MSGDLEPGALQAVVGHAAEAAQALAGRPLLGLRAVSPGTGGVAWLVAFEGPAFACLDEALAPVQSLARFRDVAQASLAAELVEEAVDADALRALAVPVAAMDPWRGELPAAIDALARSSAAAAELADWRDDPARISASLVALDAAAAIQQRAHAAYATFAELTEPLVATQDSLDPALVADLMAVEQAAAAAGLGASLGKLLAEAMPGIVEGADEMAAACITPLR